MKRRALLLFLTLSTLANLSGQSRNLAGSYYHFSLAKIHQMRQEYTKAVAQFEKAIALDPESSTLRVEFAETLWNSARTSRAVEECKKAAELDPQDPAPHFLLGQIYASLQGEGRESLAEQAITEFRTTIDLAPDHYEALYSLGRLLFAKEEFQEASEVFAGLLARWPWVVPAYAFKARSDLALGRVEEAIRILERGIEFDSTHTENLKLLAALYTEHGRAKEAIHLYRRALEEEDDPDIQYRLALLLLDGDQAREGTSILKELIREFPGNVRITFALARALREKKQYGEAAELLREALDQEPDNYQLNYDLAEILMALGEREEAFRRFTDLRNSRIGPEQKRAIDTNLALLYQKTRKHEKAIELFREIADEDSDNPFAWLRLIYALKDGGRSREALELSSRLVDEVSDSGWIETPGKSYLIIAKAQMLAANERVKDAIRLLEAQMDQAPNSEDFYLAASQIYLEQKKFKEAERILARGLSNSPENERLQFQMGAIYEQQGKLEKVETVFREILATNPDHSGVLNYLGYMFADRDMRLSEALEYVSKAVEMEPHNEAFLDSLGWVYFKLNRLDQAETNLLKAARISDGDATILDHLGDLYREKRDYFKAKEYYQKSLELADSEEKKEVQKKLKEVTKLLSSNDR